MQIKGLVKYSTCDNESIINISAALDPVGSYRQPNGMFHDDDTVEIAVIC